MKVAGLLFVAFVACAGAAVPAPIESKNDDMDSRSTRFVDGIIANAIESVSQNLRDAGLDPFELEKFDIGYQLPVPVIFNGAASAENVKVTGVSNIVINRMNFGLLTMRLTFDISLPEIVVNIGDASFDLTVLGHNLAGRTSSRLAIINAGLIGDIRVNVGIISGISLGNMDLDFYLSDMQYNGFANLFGYDITPFFSNLINHQLPATLNELRSEINELLEIVVRQFVDNNL